MTTASLEARIQRLEDRNDIIDTVISYAVSIDRADWVGYAATMTDPVHVDFSEAGLPAADFPRDQFVAFASDALDRWTARQHLSPNHQVVFDDTDPDQAICHSYMYAQHYRKDAVDGEFYLMRGSYDHRMVRTADGWKIAGVTQHVSWLEGNPNAADEAVPA
jgi:hypothetical protein